MGDENPKSERFKLRLERLAASDGRRWQLRDGQLLRAARLKTARTNGRPHSHRSLAALAGCSHGLVSHLEAGRRTVVTEALAEDLCAALGVRVADLFERLGPDT